MKKILYKTDQNNPLVKAYKDAVEKGKRDYHVFPIDGGWVVRRIGDSKTESFGTQSEAKYYAEKMACSRGTETYIHGRDGRIKDWHSYSSDSYSPRN